MAARIRRGDTVAVISGDDRGKRGRVLRVIPASDQDSPKKGGKSAEKVVVEGVNVITKHMRKSQQNPQGGRVRREAPFPACRVMPIDPETNRPTRVRAGEHEGRKVRLGVRSGARIDTAAPTRREKAAHKAGGARGSAARVASAEGEE
jgi:large subunit ribosomal protein L24